VTQSRIRFKLATNKDNLLKQIIEAENSHDIKRLLALVIDDVVIEDVPFVPFGMVMKGKDSVRQGYSGFIQATLDFKIGPKSCVTSVRFLLLNGCLLRRKRETFQVFQHQENTSL
jgi:hypothetical protein